MTASADVNHRGVELRRHDFRAGQGPRRAHASAPRFRRRARARVAAAKTQPSRRGRRRRDGRPWERVTARTPPATTLPRCGRHPRPRRPCYRSPSGCIGRGERSTATERRSPLPMSLAEGRSTARAGMDATLAAVLRLPCRVPHLALVRSLFRTASRALRSASFPLVGLPRCDGHALPRLPRLLSGGKLDARPWTQHPVDEVPVVNLPLPSPHRDAPLALGAQHEPAPLAGLSGSGQAAGPAPRTAR